MVLGQFSDICGPRKDHKGYGSAAIFQGNFNTRLYNKREVLSFLIVNFPFLLIVMFLWSHHIVFAFLSFARICNNVSDFNYHNIAITGKNTLKPIIPLP
jgi:hypothetical protein